MDTHRKQMFQCINAATNTNKFWETWTTNRSLWVRYGRIGTAGVELCRGTYETEEELVREKEKVIREKRNKGYLEVI